MKEEKEAIKQLIGETPKVEYIESIRPPDPEGTFAIVAGIMLPGMPINEIQFVELKRGSAAEIRTYGAAMEDSDVGDVHCVFSYPLGGYISTPEQGKTLTLTGKVKGQGLKFRVVKVD